MEKVVKRIAVEKENREFLMKAFGVTSVCIWNALTYKRNNSLARKIRKLALERGGYEVQTIPVGKNPMDCVETMHDSDGFIRQYFPNGAMIELSKNDETGDVFFKGECKKHYDNVTLPLIESIQNYAMGLA